MKKVALVLGGANTLHTDFEHALLIHPGPYTIIATNNAGRDYHGILHNWVTLHTEKMPKWVKERREHGLPDAEQFWTSNTKTIPKEHEELYNHVPTWDGSSGLLAVSVALWLEYDKVILCGVPLDKQAAHYDDDAPWMDAPRYRAAWTKRLKILKGKVKSFNGWTSLILGEPTRAWIND